MRFDVRFDLARRQLREQRDAARAAADEKILIADADHMHGDILGERRRFDRRDEPPADAPHDTRALNRAGNVEKPDQQQRDEGKRPNDWQYERDIHRDRLNAIDDGVEFADLYGKLVVDDNDFTTGDQDVVDIQIDRFGRELIELEHAAGD